VKAIHCVQWGTPEQLHWVDVATPQPAAGEVLIEVAAASVNFPDALIVQKKYQLQPPLPFIPGTEVAGRIVAVGTDVPSGRIGERVVAFVGLGGFAEFVCAPAQQAMTLPSRVTDEAAAAFTLTYATSQHALRDRGQLQAGETLLVLGAGGGVGLAAVELGRLAGAKVIAAASSAAKLAVAQAHGAEVLVDYSQPGWRDEVKAATGGRGVDLVCDPVGGTLTESALRLLAWRGRLLIVGFAGGEIPQLPANLLLLKGASAVGVFWGDFAQREPRANAGMLAELFGALAQGQLRPHIGQVYPLADAPRALMDLLERRAVGKLVLKP
jgi:NADPH2:quinone reductase